MANSVFFLRPVRQENGFYPSLNRAHCFNNMSKGIETSLYLDLNILSKMRQVIKKEIKYEDTFLVEFVNFVKGLQEVFISPGIALEEVALQYGADTCYAFEEFMEVYLPGYTYAYNASDESSKEENPFLICSYVNTLLIHYINLNKNLSGIDRFKKLINIMIKEVGFIGAIESMLAIYCFFNKSTSDNDISDEDRKLKEDINLIVGNFYKNSKDHNKLLSKSRNIAWDIAYYRLMGLIEVNNIGSSQECWLVTADKGIDALSRYLFYVKNLGNSMKFASPNLPEFKLFSDDCQKYYSQMMLNRDHISSGKERLEKLKILEEKLENYFLKDKKFSI